MLLEYLVINHGPLPDGAGKTIVLNTCTLCHDLSRVRQNRATAEEWARTLQAMLNEGAPLSDDEFPIVLRYLVWQDSNIPVLVGLLPLASYKNAEFLHNEVPGMAVPEGIRERMRKAGSGERAQLEGVAIAQEATLAAREMGDGVYVMPPFNKVDLAVRVIDVLR